MQTINGKLINQETKKAKNIQVKIEDIYQDIQKLEPFLGQHQQDIQSTILALKYLEQKLNHLEEKSLVQINISLQKIEQNLTKKLVTLMTISLIGFSSLVSLFMFNNQRSYSSQPKLDFNQLIEKNLVQSSGEIKLF